MKEIHMRFGDYIRKKRMADPREITGSQMAAQLGISLSYLSDIENKRKRAFEPAKIEIFADYLNLPDEERARLYDLASRETGEVPSDIEDVLMYEKIGDMARFALRQSNAGNVTEEDWKQFIRQIEKNKANNANKEQ